MRILGTLRAVLGAITGRYSAATLGTVDAYLEDFVSVPTVDRLFTVDAVDRVFAVASVGRWIVVPL